MGPQPREPRYDKATSAKELFDMIGETVQKKVHDEIVKNGDAKKYIEELKACVSQASILGELASTTDPCGLDYSKLISGSGGATARDDPCGNGSASDKRFSKESGGECDKKIKGNKGNKGSNGGACAPYRRLSLCNKNFQKINNYSSKAKHDLLLEVCLAAKYEGESLEKYRVQYEAKYPDYGSTICTILARSFADIGDIIRGKDLYRRDNKKDKLQDNLKKIFEKIHSELTSGAQTYYNDDKENYYKLREDWWTANRATVWKAITCDEENKIGDAQYFRQTCNDDETLSYANHKCRCRSKNAINETDQVPTYFDYVPQFLRWFEEWAEDFCRKKKKKLENLQKQCRGKYGDDGTERYCSRNGYDCEQTVNARGKVRMGKGCTDCFFACNPYIDWIEKQKEQFDKQKRKYETEISGGSGRQKRDAGGTTATNYEEYEKKFYAKLKDDYGNVNAFLGLLSKENVCQAVNDDKGGKINFEKVNSGSASGGGASGGRSGGASGTNDKTKGTFYRSEYCQPCPLCGVELIGNEWKEKHQIQDCKSINLYRPIDKANPTPINFLYSGDETNEIEKKLKKFCDENKNGDTKDASLYQDWQCYKIKDLQKDEVGEDDEVYNREVEHGGGLCILQKTNHEGVQKQKTYNDFFNFWVAHMLKDSIHWKKKLERCLQNGNRIKCENTKCNNDCECFSKWVVQKEEEWTNIKKHFYTQEDIVNVEGPFKLTHDGVLEGVLKLDVLLESIKSGYGKPEDIEHIKQLLQETGGGGGGENNTTIDKLLKHEKGIAEKCKNCPKPQKPQQEGGGGARIGQPRSEKGEDSEEQEEEEEDEEEEDDLDVDENGEQVDEEETHTEDPDGKREETAKEKEGTVAEDGEGEKGESGPELPEPSATPEVTPACEIVQELFKNPEDFKDACDLKYNKGKHYGWRCIPTKTSNDATSEGSGENGRAGRVPRSAEPSTTGKTTTSSATGKSDASGSICVPPRRRRLYIQKIHEWVDKVSKSQNGESSGETTQGDATSPPPSNPRDGLRDAFIQSAAIETFFLWDRYKEEKKKPQVHGALGLAALNNIATLDEASPPDPQTTLASGTIPNDFLRQMFYTLGDYRDICVGKTPDGIDTVITSDQKNKEASSKVTIQQISDKIKKAIEQSGEQTRVLPQNSGQPITRETWWNNNAKHIWNGMICALTYKENGDGAKPTEGDSNTPKITQDTAAYSQILEKIKNKDGEYHYDKVVLKEEETSGAKSNEASTASPTSPQGNGTRLAEFVTRPAYFRYLEEWGETFCRERKKRLEEIKVDCKVNENDRKNIETPKCSCYGEHCEDNLLKDYTNFPDFDCHSCGKSCGFYKKWINIKKDEFLKQKNAYGGQKDKCEKGSEGAGLNDHNKEFCVTLETWPDAAAFLNRLRPCKKDNGENEKKEDGNEKDILDFDKPDNTFKPAKNCKPCSQFKVKCERNGHCDSSKGEECDRKKSITANDIGKRPNSAEDIGMLVSGNSTTEFNGLETCKNAHIFKGFREDVWTCGNVCGYNVCKPKNVSGKANGENPIITITALVTHWVHNFLDDYNKINGKISHCIDNGKGNICKNKCNDKCKCVGEWINKKRTEWKTIRDRYINQYRDKNMDGVYKVRAILEDLQSQIPVTIDKAIKPCGDLKPFEKSCGLNSTDSSKSRKKDENNDHVLCLLDKLGEKAKTCEQKHQNSDKTEKPCQNLSPVEDDDEPLEEENPVTQPKFCPPQTTQKQEEKGGCDPAPTAEETAQPAPSGEGNPEQTPVLEPEKEAPRPEVAPGTQRKDSKPPKPLPKPPQEPQPYLPPALKNAMLSSTIMWSIGIGFATFTYFYLKVLYIYINIYGCGCGCICGCLNIYIWIYMYVFYIYILYIYIYIKKEKNEKKKKISSNKKK